VTDRLQKLLAFHEAEPRDDFATYAIAQEHIKAGDTEEALRWIEKTLQIQPDHAYAYYQKASVLSESGRADLARTAVESGLEAARRSGDSKAAGELNELLGTL
jgi:tetratricopeptide (TPR) repeat protein